MEYPGCRGAEKGHQKGHEILVQREVHRGDGGKVVYGPRVGELFVVYQRLGMEKIESVVHEAHGNGIPVGLRPGVDVGREFVDIAQA